MGAGCCATQSADQDPENQRFAKGGATDISKGPITDRHCTDLACLIVYLLHWLVFVVVVSIGLSGGDPRRLYKPRDFKGDFCGLTSLEGHVKLVQTMNVTAMVDSAARQLVCSSTSKEVLRAAWGADSQDYAQYLCTCCLSPCGRCVGSLATQDLRTGSELSSTISARMSELTNPSKAAYLFSPSGSSAQYLSGSDILREATKYFVPVCSPELCTLPAASGLADARNYTYEPPADSLWRSAWDRLAAGPGGGSDPVALAIQSTMQSQFTFQALPQSRCPYSAQYCIPMPGVRFVEAPGDYCVPKLEDSVVGAIGSSAAEAMAGLGASALAEGEGGGAGSAFGDLASTVDTLTVVAFWGFIAGVLFLVLLRFFVGCCVWTSLFAVLVLLLLGGGAAFARSHQCAGASLLDTGTTQVTAVAIVAESSLTGGPAVSEALTGDGSDYRGQQRRTRSGSRCQRWDCVTAAVAASTNVTRTCVHDNPFSPQAYPNANLSEDYCRNPANASTIWCYTTDLDKAWELCSPVGVVTTACPSGYEVPGETSRDVLRVCAYVVWAFAGVWVLLVVWLRKRIKLAIAINKVATMFVVSSPTVLLIPMAQIVIASIYCIIWVILASFLLSQVSEDDTPSDYFATYAEAYGTANTPGACTDKWPAGFVWRYAGDLAAADDPCTGRMGNTTGITPRCWRCAPPRFALDVRFAFTFFSLLWNNALLIAIGQCIIAGACAAWFFTPRSQEMKQSPLPRATWVALRYHLGSLAFGAFIIAVVEFTRYFCEYLEKQAAAQKNRVMVIVLKVVRCCIWLFEKILKFLNKNAYIQVAIMGTNFCTSAKKAFYLILRNAARFGTMLVLGAVIRVIGFTFIVVLTCLVGYFLLEATHPEVSPVLPVLSHIAVGYVIAKLYMNVFGLTVDTLLQCFIAAEEMEDSATFVPKPLLALVPGGKGSAYASSSSSPVQGFSQVVPGT